jgi:hypothetical protein
MPEITDEFEEFFLFDAEVKRQNKKEKAKRDKGKRAP